MDRSRTTHLDSRVSEQALAVLERERPSPREELLFRLLNQLVWGAVGMTALYLLLRRFEVDEDAARPVAWAAAVIYILIIPFFILNWRLVHRLQRAARLRKALAPSLRRRLMDAFTARRGQRRLANLATLALTLLGGVIVLVGVFGLMVELIRFVIGDSMVRARLILAAVMTVFGLSCIFLHFMARGRERLQIVVELRSSLLGSRNAANETQLAAEDYDEITRIERAQISSDRKRSLRAASDVRLQNPFSSKENRAVRDAKLALAPDSMANVQACIDRLIADPRADVERTQTRDGISFVRVPETSFEIGYSVDWEACEIKILSLGSTGQDGTSVGVGQE
jgi:hypothetical protein